MSKKTITKTNAPYRLKKNSRGIWTAVDKKTKKQTSLKCKGTREQAEEIADIQFGNTDDSNAAHHMKAAEAHLMKCNPEYATNTWDMVADKLIKSKRKCGGPMKLSTTRTYKSCWNHKGWDVLRHKRCIDTTPRDFEEATKDMGYLNVKFGQKLHNFAINRMLIPYAIMGLDMWPVVTIKGPICRAIKEDEHLKVLKFIDDPKMAHWRQLVKTHGGKPIDWMNEWKAFLSLLWYTGASQTDASMMKAENVKWDQGVLEYRRIKWKEPLKHAPVRVAIAAGGALEKLLKKLPKKGPLFPLLINTDHSNRCRTFARFVDWLDFSNVSMHGYRYSFAERAKEKGMSAEDRMTTLGHKNFEMTSHYDQEAQVIPASIEIIEGGLKAA